MNKSIVLMVMGIFIISLLSVFVIAQTCSVSVSSTNTVEFLKEIPTIDKSLETCPQKLPFPLSSLFKNQKVALNIEMQKDTTEIVIAEMENGYFNGITWGGTGTGYEVTTTQCGLDTALKVDSFEVIGQLYDEGKLTIKANGFGKKIILSILKPFIGGALPNPATPYTIECEENYIPPQVLVSGKPDNCDETYLPGHQGYQDNKALWDGYSLDTDNVCQSQIGKGIPSPCVHSVQLSISGTPYYLCWYNE
jgi:hypothetical protein